jgi:hypothetical protein
VQSDCTVSAWQPRDTVEPNLPLLRQHATTYFSSLARLTRYLFFLLNHTTIPQKHSNPVSSNHPTIQYRRGIHYRPHGCRWFLIDLERPGARPASLKSFTSTSILSRPRRYITLSSAQCPSFLLEPSKLLHTTTKSAFDRRSRLDCYCR